MLTKEEEKSFKELKELYHNNRLKYILRIEEINDILLSFYSIYGEGYIDNEYSRSEISSKVSKFSYTKEEKMVLIAFRPRWVMLIGSDFDIADLCLNVFILDHDSKKSIKHNLKQTIEYIEKEYPSLQNKINKMKLLGYI